MIICSLKVKNIVGFPNFCTVRLNFNLLESHKIIFDYNRSNFKNISKKFAKFEATANINDESSFDNYVDTMNSLIFEIIEKNVPKIRIKSKSFPAWLSNELKTAIIEKKT